MNNAIVFIGDINTKSLNELTRLKDTGADIYWAHSENKRSGVSESAYNKYKHITYNKKDIEYKHCKGFYNYTNILCNDMFYEYDYIYLMHSDCHYTGKPKDMISILDCCSADLIAPNVKKYGKGPNSTWMWINKYLDNTTVEDIYECYVGAFIQFFRISSKALKFYNEYNVTDIKVSGFHELSLPTVLFNNGFSIISTDTASYYEFVHTPISGITADDTFACGVKVSKANSKKLVKKYGHHVLCCGWDDETNEILKDEYWIGKEVDQPKYSVIVPVYNNETTLKESLDSIVSDNCEIIVVDEESKDGSFSIIEKYNVHYIYKKKSGLADTLNIGMHYAQGEYIFIHMPNSVMTSDRISKQCYELEKYDISLASTSRNKYVGKIAMPADMYNKEISFDYCIAFKKKIASSPILFEEYYKDHCRKFLLTMDEYNYNTIMSSSVLETYIDDKKYVNIPDDAYDYIYNCYCWKHPINPELTVIITFRNENIEVQKTVQSVRATAKNVNILLVNDASNDDTNYEYVADFWGCDYIKHDTAIGCGPSRDDGVDHCKTPYFILLDSHMRFYEMGWDERILALIKEFPGCIISSNTSIIWKDKNGYYTNEDGKGAKANTMCSTFNTKPSHLFDVTWTTKPVASTLYPELFEVYCVLGAGYCSSVEHWHNMQGLKGLSIYGLDEGLMSFKTWALGGTCYILRDLRVGHIYRPASPFPNTSDMLESARIACYYMFCEDKDLNNGLEEIKKRIGVTTYDKAYKLFLQRKQICDEVKNNIKLKRTLNEFIKVNDSFINAK